MIKTYKIPMRILKFIGLWAGASAFLIGLIGAIGATMYFAMLAAEKVFDEPVIGILLSVSIFLGFGVAQYVWKGDTHE